MTYTYSQWCKSSNKGNLDFFKKPAFRRAYTKFELGNKRRLVSSFIEQEMHSAIMSTDRVSFEVLSLGCGPGSDLLAVMDVFQSVCEAEDLEGFDIRLTGVDLFDWPWESFYRQATDIKEEGPVKTFQVCFETDISMEEYADKIWDSDQHFDFIVLSFAEVRTKMNFVKKQLPQLLRQDEGSKLFIIDNDIGQVRQLTRFGFRCVKAGDGTVFLTFG